MRFLHRGLLFFVTGGLMNRDTIALIASNAPSSIENLLKNNGFEVLRMPECKRLAPPVRTHTDMFLFQLDGTVFCHESYAKENEPIFDKIKSFGYKVITLGGEYSADYPHDVRFNIARVGRNIIIGKRTRACEICEYAIKNRYDVVKVNQGYAKCSSCVAGENALITSDLTIADAMRNAGVDVLLIGEGDVRLDGYPYGFIGGASGYFDGTVYFVGDPSFHSDGKRIFDFCKKHEKHVVYVENEELTDIGSILFLPRISRT